MKKFGIIAAMQEEMQEIQKIMDNVKETKIYDLNFIIGEISNYKVVLVEAGIGKVNDAIINVGSAAASNEKLNIGDIVIANKLVQHDFDITAFGHPKGYISNVGQYLESDKELVINIEKAIKKIDNNKFKTIIGTIASGDIFCTEINMKDKIKSKFNADAIEMEGAAIAQVCKLDNIPFIVIRGISDSPNGNNKVTFEEYLEQASQRCAELIEIFMKN